MFSTEQILRSSLTRRTRLVLIPIQFSLVRAGQDLANIMMQNLAKQKVRLRTGDVVAVASKVVSICERRIAKLDSVRISNSTKQLATKWKMDMRLTAIVKGEADRILGGVDGFLLTLKNGILTANAGVDMKNSPPGTVTLWPENPDRSARQLQKRLERNQAAKIGVEIVDSRVTPLRLGTTGLAIGVSGFNPIADERGRPDLYARGIRVTQSNVADDLAAAAHVLMGERTEQVGAVVVRGAPVGLGDFSGSNRAKLRAPRCLIASNLRVESRS